MAQYQILILPVFALALIVFFPIFNNVNPLSRSWRSVRRRRTMLARLFVFALLIATFLSIIWPVGGMNRLVQGVLITAAIMLPFCLAHLFLSMKYKMVKMRSDSGLPNNSFEQSGSEQFSLEKSHAAPVDLSLQKHYTDDRSVDAMKPVPLTDDSYRKSVVQNNVVSTDSVGSPVPILHTDTAEHTGTLKEVHLDVLEQQWMDARETQGVELEDSTLEFPHPPIEFQEPELAPAYKAKRRESEITEDDDLAILERPATRTRSKSTEAAYNIVKLKKLLAKQQAAFKLERQAHLKTQSLTRKAGQLVRTARTAQKNAEQAVEIERAKRRLVEQKYEQVAKALRGALTVLDEAETQPPVERVAELN